MGFFADNDHYQELLVSTCSWSNKSAAGELISAKKGYFYHKKRSDYVFITKINHYQELLAPTYSKSNKRAVGELFLAEKGYFYHKKLSDYVSFTKNNYFAVGYL